MSSKKEKKNKLLGSSLIKSNLQAVPNTSGVYQMIDSNQKIIYIGKAKNLKNRLSSYTNNALSPRIAYMVSLISSLKWITTKNEQDALLLEADLIKRYQPFYNILLKDDKSYPFLKIDTTHLFPRVIKYRNKSGILEKDCFGPFASSKDLLENIKLIQSIFKIRTCTDSYFVKTKQPCLLYQVKKCSAPCVDKISKEEYLSNIKEVISFLNGNTLKLKEQLITNMQQASMQQNYELAISFREKIKSLNHLEVKQSIFLKETLTADFFCIAEHNTIYALKVASFKNGHNYGFMTFFPEIQLEVNLKEVLENTLVQYYSKRKPPSTIYINLELTKHYDETIQNIQKLFYNKYKKKVRILNPKKEQYLNILNILMQNIITEITEKEFSNQKWQGSFLSLQKYFNITKKIKKIEIYDNSHLQGTFPLGVMVCANISGFCKSSYRVFKLKNKEIKSNDDYGILREVLTRRFQGSSNKKLDYPELVLIDGGKGQLSVAKEIKENLFLKDITFVAIAKGKNRNAGKETLILEDGTELNPNQTSSNLHFLQRLRNEAHRFAIKSLRRSKEKSLTVSKLDNISFIGEKRKQALLNHFGSITDIKKASIKELIKINGINQKIAIKIFNWFN